jgi:hypothetical protein
MAEVGQSAASSGARHKPGSETHEQDAAEDEAGNVRDLAARAKDRQGKVLVVGPREHVDDQVKGRGDASGGTDALDGAQDEEGDLILAEADAEAKDTDPGAREPKCKGHEVSDSSGSRSSDKQ